MTSHDAPEPAPIDTDRPALFGDVPQTTAAGVMRREVEATIGALDSLGLLETRHRGLCQVARTLADVFDHSARYGKAYAAAQVARELRETLAALPEPEHDAGDVWQQFEDAVKAATEAGTT